MERSTSYPNKKFLDKCSLSLEECDDISDMISNAQLGTYTIMCVSKTTANNPSFTSDYTPIEGGECEKCEKEVWLSERKIKLKKFLGDKAKILCDRCCVAEWHSGQHDGQISETGVINIKGRI